MTERVELTGEGERIVSPWQAIGIFLLLTICLTGIFFQLTTANEKTKWVAGDLGSAFVAVAAVVAVVFWAKGGKLKSPAAQAV